MIKRHALVVAFAACLAFPAHAGPATNALGACLADNTTGKERKELAKWIFIGMAAHPDIQDVSKVPPSARDDSDRTIGELVTRLLTKNCVTQARTAINSEGAGAFKAAFQSLGELAMQELMSNQAVESSLSGWEKYFDRKTFEAAMAAK